MNGPFICPDCKLDNTEMLDGFESKNRYFIVCMQCGTMFMPIYVYVFEHSFEDNFNYNYVRLYTTFYYFKRK